MKIWYDAEFIEDGSTIDLISIGMVREDGETYYAESLSCDTTKASKWVIENVFPKLTGQTQHQKGNWQIAREIVQFVGEKPEFWAYFADYDWVVLCQLYGRMIYLPKGWPMFCLDLMQSAHLRNISLPANDGVAHNALDDALWCKKAWEHVQKHL